MTESTPATPSAAGAALPLGRQAFLLRVKPERIDDYVEAHRHVWPEMQDALRRTGWGDYTLFLDRVTGLVAGFVRTDDLATAQRGMSAEDVNARWQASMAEFFLPVDDRAEPGESVALEEYFHLDDRTTE